MRRAANLGLKWAFFACISRITLQPTLALHGPL